MRRCYQDDVAKEIERPRPQNQAEYDARQVQFTKEEARDGVVANERMDKRDEFGEYFICL